MPKYDHFSHKDCEYYPCHKGVPELNCLFCYCPLYFLECPGDPKTLPNGIKDCSSCDYPHIPENYTKIIAVLADAMKNKDLSKS